MRILKSAATALAALIYSNAANAQTITLREPEMIAELLRVEGYEATIDPVKPDEDPIITGTKDGVKFGVYFSNCEKGKECQSVELYSGFKDHKLSHESINQWNREKRFVRAYLDKQSDAVLSMDVNVEPGGMERKLFVDNLEIWWSLLSQFEERAYPAEPAKPATSSQ